MRERTLCIWLVAAILWGIILGAFLVWPCVRWAKWNNDLRWKPAVGAYVNSDWRLGFSVGTAYTIYRDGIAVGTVETDYFGDCYLCSWD